MHAKARKKAIIDRIDDRWKTQEKISLYTGVVNIFTREKTKEVQDAQKQRRKQIRQIRELRKDCKYFRGVLESTTYGDKQRMRNVLQNRSILLMFQNHSPSKLMDYFEHVNTRKQKELDRLRYKKFLRMKVYANLKLEKGELQDNLDVGRDNKQFRGTVQLITNRIQTFVVKQNAAASIYKLYQNMLHLLHQDSQYYDSILKVVHGDCEEQCRFVLRAAELGQKTNEELADIKNLFAWLETKVKDNLKQRDKEVKYLRMCADDLDFKCKKMSRPESYGFLYGKTEANMGILRAEELEREEREERKHEIKEMESFIKRIQDATLASAFFDVLPRMYRQLRQEQCLILQVARMKQFRDRVLLMKHHAEITLASLQHQVASSTVRFENETERITKEMAGEKHRLSREQETIEEHGEMLRKLKLVLQSMFDTLNNVKSDTTNLSEASSSSSLVVDILHMSPLQIEKMLPPPYEQNSEVILCGIEKSLKDLQQRAKETLPEEVTLEARITHLRQLLQKRLYFEEPEFEVQLLEDQEAEDLTVLTRSDIKNRSKDLVNKHHLLLLASRREQSRSIRRETS